MSQQLKLQYCDKCGNVKLEYIDFTLNTKNRLVCCYCDNISPTKCINANMFLPSQNKINAWSPIEKQQELEIIHVDPEPEIKPVEKPQGKIWIDWSDVIGYEKIKIVINRILNSTNEKKTHLLICGAAGTSKTVFLKTVENSLRQQNLNVQYLDATTLSSAGVIDFLFANDVKYCLIDEIDKLEKEHQRVFLNMLESGILQETKGKKDGIRKKDVKETIFLATGNYKDKIMFPLRTRFMTFEIPKYTKQEFYQIGEQLLQTKKYNKTPEIAYYIVDRVWDIFTTKRHVEPNLRYARDVASITDNSKATIDPVLDAISQYSDLTESE